jgi:hypothetical protein
LIEPKLVDQLAILIWRNRRLTDSECAMLNARRAGANDPMALVPRYETQREDRPLDQAMLQLGEQLLIGRYHVMLTNQMMSIIEALHRTAEARED